jgi:hypothetical protein
VGRDLLQRDPGVGRGIESFSVDVTLDTGDSDTSTFEIAYDAIIEAIPDHQAVVVLTDPSGNVSTPGVITSSDDTVTVALANAADASPSTGILDMIGYGFRHVLDGADHLLFLFPRCTWSPAPATTRSYVPSAAPSPWPPRPVGSSSGWARCSTPWVRSRTPPSPTPGSSSSVSPPSPRSPGSPRPRGNG